MYPGAQVFWAKWSPPHERSRLVAFAFGGKGTEIEININQRCVQQRESARQHLCCGYREFWRSLALLNTAQVFRGVF